MYPLLFFRFSVSNDLKYDAERDLRDIGAKNIQVHSLNKVRFSDALQEALTCCIMFSVLVSETFLFFSSNMARFPQNITEV